MTHSFNRYTAAGNTFLVLNTWEDPLSLYREHMRELVRGACDYQTGAGADGLILINQLAPSPNLSPRRGEEKKIADFRMDFYNPDGTTGMLCGNGARCAAMAARNYGFATRETTTFEVLGAINSAVFLPNGDVRVYFQDPTVIRLNFKLDLTTTRGEVTASYVDLGSQHVVVFFDDHFGDSIEDFDIAHFGSLLRWHPEFAPKGANANFIEVREDGDEKYLRIRTFERGVEGETLACGTGCMSSAIVARLTQKILKTPIRLLTQSGEFVTVNFKIEGEHITNLSLEGSIVTGEAGMLSFDEHNGSLTIKYD